MEKMVQIHMIGILELLHEQKVTVWVSNGTLIPVPHKAIALSSPYVECGYSILDVKIPSLNYEKIPVQIRSPGILLHSSAMVLFNILQ